MGRRPRDAGQEEIIARVSPGLRARIEEAAAWRGVSVASFLVEAAAREAEHVIEKERLFQLTRDDAELVLSLLDAPPSPNAAMSKAVRAHHKLISS
jgi:uncharacterized protein (DUF1778 family)